MFTVGTSFHPRLPLDVKQTIMNQSIPFLKIHHFALFNVGFLFQIHDMGVCLLIVLCISVNIVVLVGVVCLEFICVFYRFQTIEFWLAFLYHPPQGKSMNISNENNPWFVLNNEQNVFVIAVCNVKVHNKTYLCVIFRVSTRLGFADIKCHVLFKPQYTNLTVSFLSNLSILI